MSLQNPKLNSLSALSNLNHDDSDPTDRDELLMLRPENDFSLMFEFDRDDCNVCGCTYADYYRFSNEKST